MKRFVKGNLDTVVDEDDPRIPSYMANGWKPAEPQEKPLDKEDAQRRQAIADANASEPTGGDKKKRRNPAGDKKVNDAMSAAARASAESGAVDDGLLKKGGK